MRFSMIDFDGELPNNKTIMSPQQILEKLQKTKPQKIGKMPVVVLPLEEWKQLEQVLEEYQMQGSKTYRRSIEVARKQIKYGPLYSFDLKTGILKKRKT